MADEDKGNGGEAQAKTALEDNTFEALERDFQEVRGINCTCMPS